MIVSWMTTNQCNLKCVHCYQDAEEATERELTTDEAKKMIDEIARAGFKIMSRFSVPTFTSWWPMRPPAACARCSAATARSSPTRWPAA